MVHFELAASIFVEQGRHVVNFGWVVPLIDGTDETTIIL